MNSEYTKLIFALVNFALFIGLLFILLRKKVATFLAERRSLYLIESQNGQKLVLEAELKLNEIKTLRDNIKIDGQALLNRAKHDVETFEEKILKESAELGLRIQEDNRRLAASELLLAGKKLRAEFVDELIAGAKSDISSGNMDDANKKYIKELENIV